MYLDGSDYQTVWRLAHSWAKQTECTNGDVSAEVRLNIHRILIAIRNDIISVRTPMGVLFADDSTLTFFLELRHYLKFRKLLHQSKFDVEYLENLYVWRPEVIRWCSNHQLAIPHIWQDEADNSDDTDPEAHWYHQLTPRRKKIAGALFIAKRLWEEDSLLDYIDVYNHPDMTRYDKPRSFNTLESFKEWAKSIAPVKARSGGKRSKSM